MEIIWIYSWRNLGFMPNLELIHWSELIHYWSIIVIIFFTKLLNFMNYIDDFNLTHICWWLLHILNHNTNNIDIFCTYNIIINFKCIKLFLNWNLNSSIITSWSVSQYLLYFSLKVCIPYINAARCHNSIFFYICFNIILLILICL